MKYKNLESLHTSKELLEQIYDVFEEIYNDEEEESDI